MILYGGGVLDEGLDSRLSPKSRRGATDSMGITSNLGSYYCFNTTLMYHPITPSNNNIIYFA